MGNERFYQILKIFLVLNPSFILCQDQSPYRFRLDPDPYQSSVWIRFRIRNEFFQPLDPDDPYQMIRIRKTAVPT